MSKKEPRLSLASLKILKALLGAPRKGISGMEIATETGVFTGTLYPALARLEKAGWATSYWEDADPRLIGRPRRRFYKLTAVGAAATKAALNDLAHDETTRPAGGWAWA